MAEYKLLVVVHRRFWLSLLRQGGEARFFTVIKKELGRPTVGVQDELWWTCSRVVVRKWAGKEGEAPSSSCGKRSNLST